MENNNIQIVLDANEQIVNQKRFDRMKDFFHDDYVYHSAPYIGLGIQFDDSSGTQVVIKQVAAKAPATGKVQPGDIVLHVQDAGGSWDGFENLRNGLWGLGVLGTPVTLTLLRDGATIDVTLVRGRVESFDGNLENTREIWQNYLTQEIPDLHCEINQILASGDRVAFYAVNTGTNARFHQSAVWTECNIVRLEDGKIREWWSVEDSLSMRYQFGFRLVEPVKPAG